MENLTLWLNETYISPIAECKLDQAELLNQTVKIPSQGYYILLLGLACLLFYFFIQPRLGEKFKESYNDKLGILGVCLVFLSSWVLFFGVFHLSTKTIDNIVGVAKWFVLPLLFVIAFMGYRYVRRRMNLGE